MGYAIKIGEIHLRSDSPITEEQRRKAIRALLKKSREVADEAGLEIVDIIGSGIK